MIRRALLIIAAVAILTSACARHTFNLSPECPSHDQATAEQVAGFITLMVQSVPDADLYPCVERLRPGWDITNVDAEKGRTTITLSSDRLGFQFLRVYLNPSCEISGFATGHPTDDDESGALLYQDIDETLTGLDEEGEYEGSWWYIFEGGCVEFEFNAEGPGIDRIADDVREAFSFFPRSLADDIVHGEPESRRGL